jgi:hypothetical protein
MISAGCDKFIFASTIAKTVAADAGPADARRPAAALPTQSTMPRALLSIAHLAVDCRGYRDDAH